MADWENCGEAGQGAYGGHWTPDRQAHAKAEIKHRDALDRGDANAAWEARQDMLHANGYHTPNRHR